MTLKDYIENEHKNVSRVFDAINKAAEFVEKARETLREQAEYYPDTMPITNNDILDNVWYDRKEFGDPPISKTAVDNPFIIVVRYFEPTVVTAKFRSKLAVDIGYWRGNFWCIDNDWDECGMGVEVLAYKRCDSSMPDRCLNLPTIDVLKDGSIGFKNSSNTSQK